MHDQYHQASFILDKIKRATPYVDSLSYWTFTDIFEEAGPRFEPFHGGFGLMNLEGIRKPSYFAYRFLRQLGEQDVATSDPQSWATKSADGSVQALVWDYTPIVPPKGEIDQTYYKKELPPANKGTVRVEIDQLPKGRYSVSTYAVGYQKNDAYTAYLRMGAPTQLTQAQVQALDKIASGAPVEQSVIEHSGGAFVREMPLRENDIYLIVLSRL
jgi:xylan 1,4-beta-xylosidase